MLFASNPEGVDGDVRGRSIAAINDLNRLHALDVQDPEIQTRIAAYELAYRMQTSVPELTDVSKEPASVHELYGTEPGQPSFANNCLLARRWSSAAMRSSVYLALGYHGASSVRTSREAAALCRETDRPISAADGSEEARAADDTRSVGGGSPQADKKRGTRLEVPRPGSHPRRPQWPQAAGSKPGVAIGRTTIWFTWSRSNDVQDLHATMLRCWKSTTEADVSLPGAGFR